MNNGKKYLIIALGILMVLMVCFFILQSIALKRITPNAGTGYLSPTVDPYQYRNPNRTNNGSNGSANSATTSPAGQGGGSSSSEDKAVTELDRLKRQLPLETDDYVVVYSPNLDKVVLTRKTDAADNAFDDWLTQNNYPDLIENPYTTIYSDKTMEEVQTPYVTNTPQQQIQKIYNMMGVLLQEPKITPSTIPTPTLKPTPTSIPAQSSSSKSSSTSAGTPKDYNGFVYYSQCHGQYDSYPLTSTCTLCRAGCGPTTVSMILSSYVDKKYTPPYVVEMYRNLGGAACGTGMPYAKSILSSNGVKTSDYIIPYREVNGIPVKHDVKEVADDLRAYINSGWTIFVLATYQHKDGSWGGHYFWMTDMSDSGNVMAFDPYYGMDQTPPINENGYYPNPKYEAAFGVKKQ